MTSLRNGLEFEEHPSAYLRRAPVQLIRKKRALYDPQHPCARLYMVIAGRVKVTTAAENGNPASVRFVCAEGLFGECSLIGSSSHNETAVAIDNVAVMSWTREEIEHQIERNPRLGVVLIQFQTLRCMQLQDRINERILHTTRQRVMLALLHLAEDAGLYRAGGVMRIEPLTQTTIAEYVGTSREVVTAQMNRLRRKGAVRYSRRFIEIELEVLKHELARSGVPAIRFRYLGICASIA